MELKNILEKDKWTNLLNKTEVTASSSVLKLWAMSFNFFFILAHNFSIGFKSGEYGGRNNRQCPVPLIIFSNIFFLWNLALSITIRTFFSNFSISLKSISLNHSSKNSLSIVSLYIILPISAFPIFPATRFILEYLNPLFFPSIDIPLLLQPYSR